jgi:hypothetical protein
MHRSQKRCLWRGKVGNTPMWHEQQRSRGKTPEEHKRVMRHTRTRKVKKGRTASMASHLREFSLVTTHPGCERVCVFVLTWKHLRMTRFLTRFWPLECVHDSQSMIRFIDQGTFSSPGQSPASIYVPGPGPHSLRRQTLVRLLFVTHCFHETGAQGRKPKFVTPGISVA